MMMTTLLRAAWDRFRTNLRDPIIRRNVACFMGGKLLGLALVLTVMWVVLPAIVHATTHSTVAEQADATLTLVDWLTILEQFGWCCAYCLSKPFEVMSHVIPLPRGGTTPDNCVPACYSCCTGKRKTRARHHVEAWLAGNRSALNQDHQRLTP